YGGRYTLSPDGKWVVYTTTMDRQGEQSGNDGPQADVWRNSADGRQATKNVRFPSPVHDVCLHGQQLIILHRVGGAHYDLWQISLADPQRMRKLTAGQADEDRPSISRDGKWLVYTDNRHGATALIVRDLVTTKEEMVGIDRLDFRSPVGALRLR